MSSSKGVKNFVQQIQDTHSEKNKNFLTWTFIVLVHYHIKQKCYAQQIQFTKYSIAFTRYVKFTTGTVVVQKSPSRKGKFTIYAIPSIFDILSVGFLLIE